MIKVYKMLFSSNMVPKSLFSDVCCLFFSDSIIIFGRTSDGVRVTVRWFYLDQYPMYQEEVRWVSAEEGHHIIFPSPYILRVPTQLVSTYRKGIDHQENKYESYKPAFETELEAFYALVKTGKQDADPIVDGLEDLIRNIRRKY